jgi:ABC-type glycerol-3-phosphate transport system substrate-binding protein
MNKVLKASVALAALVVSGGMALADCGIEKGSVRILSNDFQALHVIADAASTCASGTVEVTKNQTTEHKNIQVPALQTNPATYTVAMIANNSIVPLLNDGLVRPLDDLVAKYGQQLQPNQLIKIDGKIMAIAFMANSQHLYYREDVLAKYGIAVPKTYDELQAAAKTLQENGMKAPFYTDFKPGWDLAAEFVNMYLGTGKDFFKSGTAEPDIQTPEAVAVLEQLKALAAYAGSDYLTYDATAVKSFWESGESVLGIGWGSRAGALIGDDSPTPDIAKETRFAGAPTIQGGSIPAAALWWDGFAIAKNISDEDAEASFRAMMVGISPDNIAAHPKAAAWLVKGYEPTPAAVGVFETAQGGARPYPMLPYMGLLHTALGDNLAEFMQGQESAEQALADVTAAYTTKAKEGGFIK